MTQIMVWQLYAGVSTTTSTPTPNAANPEDYQHQRYNYVLPERYPDDFNIYSTVLASDMQAALAVLSLGYLLVPAPQLQDNGDADVFSQGPMAHKSDDGSGWIERKKYGVRPHPRPQYRLRPKS